MARRSRRWRPRNLFPGTTALWIQLRRAPHHARLRVRSFFASPSLWTTSVMAGMLAIVLTLLLFVVGPPPEVALQPAGTSEAPPAAPLPAPQIALSVQQGAFPVWWDQREQLVVQSQPALGPTPIELAFANSGWSQTGSSVPPSRADDPGEIPNSLVLPIGDDPPLLESSDRPPISPATFHNAQLGVAVEKVWLGEGDQPGLQEHALIVRNTLSAPLERVVVREMVPDVKRVVNAEPPPTLSRQGELLWELGAMDQGAELEIHVSYLPADEGPLETHAVVDMQSRIGVVTSVSEPFTPEPEVASPEPAVTEPDMPLPEPVLPAGLAGDPPPFLPADTALPVDDEAPPQPIDEPLRDLVPSPADDPAPELPVDEPAPVVTPAAPAEVPAAVWPPIDPIEPLEPHPRPLVESVPAEPLLRIHSESPGSVARGDVVTTVYEIRNDGAAAAENITLTVHITDELLHRHGANVKHTIDRLEPGEVRQARLRTRARDNGTATLDAALKYEGESVDSELSYIRVTTAGAPQPGGDWNASGAAPEEPPATPGEVLR